jgi:hypothetical protein
VEDHDDFILGPVSPKEYKDTMVELNGSRTNRVFEFFKVITPECLGFAKHREAAERKAAALTAAETDAGETAMSPRARSAPSKKTTKKISAVAAATAEAEGKARKKRGTRPMDSPPTAKRMCVVDLETDVVGSVIAAMPLRVVAPSGGACGDASGPLLVPLSPKEKDSYERAMFASCPQLVKLLVTEAPHPSVTKPLAMKANLARRPPARQVHQLKTLASPPLLQR